jgi:glycosyltransferase involved in cell wall biosynthesis
LPPARPALSAVLITLNAERQLAACLASVGFADEILVVDSGSTDATCQIAQRAGARVIQHPWLGFGPQKAYAVSQARHDWVLCIDADEQLSPALASSIQEELARVPPRARCFALARCNRFMGRWLRHGEGYPDWTLRLFRRDAAHWSASPVHERVLSEEAPVRLAGDLLHDSAETLSSYLAKQSRYTSLQAEGLRGRGRLRNLASLVLSPLARFIKFYVLRLGFLDGLPGLVHIGIGCLAAAGKYYKALRPPA